MGIKFGKEKLSFLKKKIGVRQLVACSLQLNFNGEIKCLRIIKRLNLDNSPQGKSANGQICNVGGGEGKLARFVGGGGRNYYCIQSTSFLTGHMGLHS